jgi:hypothetical protein
MAVTSSTLAEMKVALCMLRFKYSKQIQHLQTTSHNNGSNDFSKSHAHQADQQLLHGCEISHWPPLLEDMEQTPHLHHLQPRLLCHSGQNLHHNSLASLCKKHPLIFHVLVAPQVKVFFVFHLPHVHHCPQPPNMLHQGVNFGNKQFLTPFNVSANFTPHLCDVSIDAHDRLCLRAFCSPRVLKVLIKFISFPLPRLFIGRVGDHEVKINNIRSLCLCWCRESLQNDAIGGSSARVKGVGCRGHIQCF